LRYRAKFRGDRSNRCRDMAILQFCKNGSRPPSWIRCVRVGTTHTENLIKFIIVQNLVGIDAVVLIIWRF